MARDEGEVLHGCCRTHKLLETTVWGAERDASLSAKNPVGIWG